MDLAQERELVEKSRKDPESFGRLFDIYYGKIFAYIFKRTGHTQASQDITSEVFLKAYNKLWQFRWMNLSFGSWLYKIAGNEVNNYFKKGKTAPIPAEFIEELEHLGVCAPSAELEFLGLEQQQASLQDLHLLHREILNLPPKYQEVMALRYFEDYSLKEICKILGKKEGTVKSLLSRGVDMLEKKLQPNSTNEVISTKTIIKSTSYEQTGN
ncbi:MAG: RNA polymerase sigma factor [Candidatus Doudnabacteria bacterium]|nr:RNA polymerase sigma factor [Candidatus Doudnabacteria bacterium]